MSADNSEIQRVRKSEERRGRRGQNKDEQKIKEERERKKDYEKLLASMDWQQFLKAIQALGHKPGTSEYDGLVLVWKEYQQDLKQRRQRRKHR